MRFDDRRDLGVHDVQDLDEEGAKSRDAGGDYYYVYFETVRGGDENYSGSKMGQWCVDTYAFQMRRSTVIPNAPLVLFGPLSKLGVIQVKSERAVNVGR